MDTELLVSGVVEAPSTRPAATRAGIALLASALCIVAACSAGPAGAHDYALGSLHIEHPYARPTPPGARTGGAYFTIQNNGLEADFLVGVESPVAHRVELHSMGMTGNLMKMRPVKGVEIAGGSKVTFGAGTYHVMLLELRRPLSSGAQVPLTLHFEKAGVIDVSANVEAAPPRGKVTTHDH